MMHTTKRKPNTVGHILVSEFLGPLGIELSVLADAMGVHRNSISRIVNNKGPLTPKMAIRLAAALGTSPQFWLNIQHAVDIWEVSHSKASAKDLGIKTINPTALSNTTYKTV